jgi:hypothetical protein
VHGRIEAMRRHATKPMATLGRERHRRRVLGVRGSERPHGTRWARATIGSAWTMDLRMLEAQHTPVVRRADATGMASLAASQSRAALRCLAAAVSLLALRAPSQLRIARSSAVPDINGSFHLTARGSRG